MNFWMIKQEPEKYSFDDLITDGMTNWTGVRNYQARNNLQAMRLGDQILFYHSRSEKSVVGIAEVSGEAFQDETDETGKWIAVKIKPVKKFENFVMLEQIKADEVLQNIALIKQSRLSVLPLTQQEFERIIELTK